MARQKAARSTVIPVMMGDVVTCQCGHEMKPWNFVSFPHRRRYILWRCEHNPDHISAMLPLPNTASGNNV